MNFTRHWVCFLAVLSACSAPPSTDGGFGGGGSATGGGSGGGGGGASDGGAFTFVCRDAGVVTDAGIDSSALLGPVCDPAHLDALIQTCRVEPQDYFLNYRCGTNPIERFTELQRNSAVYSCPVIGADVMACVAPRLDECRNPDGGRPVDTATERIISECSASLGRPRYLASCSNDCNSRHSACFDGCRACGGFESCAACSFECGRQFVGCLRGCPPP